MGPMEPLILSALCLVIGVLLIVVASTVVEGHNGWPLLCLIFYVFAPIPFFLCGGASHGRGRITLFKMIGLFIGGCCASVGPLMALVLYHLGSMTGKALCFTLLSGVCFLINASFLLASTREDDSDADDEVEEDNIFS
eukprot:gene9276-6521_t